MNDLERVAFNWGLNYKKMNDRRGDIGLMCNGTGMNLASTDLVSSHGGFTANFLDLGGDSSMDDYNEALHLLEFDKRLSVLFVNIFGGVFKLVPLIKIITGQLRREDFTKPIVMRLRGFDEDLANSMIEDFLADESVADDIKSLIYLQRDPDKAAQLAVKLAEQKRQAKY
jgi:succinyl-CoA synthetase beta subunit